ncbi:MAG: Rrf2 family transcriptional regulator [Myxococcales bacterium]|nr:Rrf2 family transcriptional regulator [Myxococcales bacterium]
MQLTLFSDYSLRVALYLAMHPDERVTLDEISAAYGISRNHLVKVVQRLVELEVVASVRGRGGGLRLAKAPAELNVGALVRATEPHFNIVECFDPETNTCPIDPVCGLKGVLRKAEKAFLAQLDAHSLADFLPRAERLIPLWRQHAGRDPRG